MIPKSNRLSKKSFQEIFDKGLFSHSPYFSSRYIKNGKETHFSVVVPKAISKQAVSRNRIRRIWYSVLGDLMNKYQIKGSFIFILKKGNIKVLENTTEVSSVLEKFFKSIK